ncbi:MAG: hypothetical protein H2069_06505 [Legionella sp.]|nr:hypothetical protein [Legionella sp.]
MQHKNETNFLQVNDFLKNSASSHEKSTITLPLWFKYILDLNNLEILVARASEFFFHYADYQYKSLTDINRSFDAFLNQAKNNKETIGVVMFLYDKERQSVIACVNLTLGEVIFIEDLGSINSNKSVKSFFSHNNIKNCYLGIGALMMTAVSLISLAHNRRVYLVDVSNGFYNQFLPSSEDDSPMKAFAIPKDINSLTPNINYYEKYYPELKLQCKSTSKNLNKWIDLFSIYKKIKISNKKDLIFQALNEREPIEKLKRIEKNLFQNPQHPWLLQNAFMALKKYEKPPVTARYEENIAEQKVVSST